MVFVTNRSSATGGAFASNRMFATTSIGQTPPINLTLPSITGTAEIGETLTLNLGSWTGDDSLAGELRYVSDDTVVDTYTANGTYVVLVGDAGEALYLYVTATNNGGSTSAQSAATETIELSAPLAPSITAPTTGSTVSTRTPTIEWTRSADDPADGTVTYDVTIAGVTLTGNTGVNGTSYIVSSALALSDTAYTVTVTPKRSGVSGATDSDTFYVTPASIANLALWFDPSTAYLYQDSGGTTPVAANNDPVGRWVDRSGNSNHGTQSSAGSRPLYKTNMVNGKPALYLDGGDSLTLTTDITGVVHTFFIVANKTITGSGYQSLLGTGDFSFLGRHSEFNAWGLYCGNAISAGQTLSTDFSVLTALMRAANDLDLATNGAASTFTNGSTPPTGTTSWIGTNGSYPHTGHIAYILRYARALSTSEREAVEAYLAATFAITVSRGVQLVFDGDSLTAGTGASQTNNYPTQTMLQLTARRFYWNFGVSGQTVAQMTSDAVSQVDAKYSASNDDNIVVLWGGVNDIRLSASAETVYARLLEYTQARQAAGWKVVVLTMLPSEWTSLPADYETKRQAVNTSIRNNAAAFDAIADIGADPTIGEAGDSSNTTYYNADKIHMTPAGYGIVAGIVKTAIETLF